MPLPQIGEIRIDTRGSESLVCVQNDPIVWSKLNASSSVILAYLSSKENISSELAIALFNDDSLLSGAELQELLIKARTHPLKLVSLFLEEKPSLWPHIKPTDNPKINTLIEAARLISM